jgi:hypothetical protein
MTNIQIKEIDVTTGEELVKNANQNEKQSLTALFEKNQKEQLQIETNAQAKTVAEGKLAALGLTTNDLRALGL